MQLITHENTVTHPTGTEEIELLTGEQAIDLLSDVLFASEWDALYQSCPWATVFQSRSFVENWYRVYQGVYSPLLVKAAVKGKLTGLLTMAVPLPGQVQSKLRNSSGRIVGAGHFEAEYQVWLAHEHNGSTFIKAALAAVSSRFPSYSVLFRFLPPNTPLQWAKEDPSWKGRCILQSSRRPLMDLKDPEHEKLFRKGEYRNKLNRLKRLGNVSFERITDLERFVSILEEVAVQFDFRQGAMFNKNLFRDNPLKAVFLQAMFRENLLHVTVLKVNEEVKAAIAAVIGKDWVHLGGINVHTPFHASYYSPGFVHFLTLGQQLAQEGTAVFDLTPGGDAYKDRIANKHDHVYELTITGTRAFHTKKVLKKFLHERLITAGLRPMSVELSVRKAVYIIRARLKAIKSRGTLSLLPSLLRDSLHAQPDRFYIIRESSQEAPVAVERDSLEALLSFEAAGGWQTRWEFLGEAMRRLEAGEHCYTWRREGRLLCCAWFSPALGQAGATLRGIYCHPDGRAGLAAFLRAAAGQVAREEGHGQVLALAEGTATRRALEAAGFEEKV
ncbi:GNAT family N-acetyltransferase [Pontibacter actiniarum]|uniref:BioF2-like acetyltransferase domain-containing protein n=1 Tax=Pontibacter actiniarum TaxID=323450 RepID=A0A1X9YTN6_9BACT|nr:GNAT family N-acetyltransferase [Pontibacter actiniarum]ARS36247.1 hypothetical protein CA264_12825 [Pontibacter actiniarum]